MDGGFAARLPLLNLRLELGVLDEHLNGAARAREGVSFVREQMARDDCAVNRVTRRELDRILHQLRRDRVEELLRHLA